MQPPRQPRPGNLAPAASQQHYTYQAQQAPTPQMPAAVPSSMQPQPAPGPPLPTGYTGSIFTPSCSGGSGCGGCGGCAGGSCSSAAGGSAADSLASGAASALGLDASAAQQVAANVALSYLSGGGLGPSLEGSVEKLDKMSANFTNSRLDMLRYYFDVNNAYVLRKLRILLLPFRHTDWERKANQQGQPLRPSQDVNAPDLYLPLMGYVTYILVAGFISGADGRFTPEVLGMTASSGSAIVLLEVVLIKLLLYLLQSDGGGALSLDLASCSGYKFIAAVVVLLVKTFFGLVAGYVAILLAGAAIGMFMMKTIQQCLVQGSGFSPGFMTNGMGSPGRSEKRKKQMYSLVGVACLQPLLFWYLSRV